MAESVVQVKVDFDFPRQLAQQMREAADLLDPPHPEDLPPHLQEEADGTVAAVLLQGHTASAPGDIS